MAELFEDGQDAAAGANGGENKATKVGVVRADRRKLLVWPGADGREYLLTPDLHRKLQLTRLRHTYHVAVLLTERDSRTVVHFHSSFESPGPLTPITGLM